MVDSERIYSKSCQAILSSIQIKPNPVQPWMLWYFGPYSFDQEQPQLHTEIIVLVMYVCFRENYA